MSTIIGLVVAALVLVFFEVILPGGILGLVAAGCVVLGIWIAGVQYGALAAGLTFVGSLLAVALLVFIEFKVLARTSIGAAFLLRSTVSGHSNEAPAEDTIVGREAITMTRLNPSGKVAIDGQSYEAYSRDGYIEADQPVRIAGRDNFKLIIEKL